MYKDIPKIRVAEARENFQLFLSFDDGISGIVDLSEYRGKGVFGYWNDDANFKKFEIVWNAITWNENLDLNTLNLHLTITNKTFEKYCTN